MRILLTIIFLIALMSLCECKSINKNKPKMSYYNHFSKATYATICFESLNNGDKFRMDKFKGKRRRKDIIMIKVSDHSYIELKSGKKYTVYTSAFDVYSFDQLNQPS